MYFNGSLSAYQLISVQRQFERLIPSLGLSPAFKESIANINKMVSKGYAEEVSLQELSGDSGKMSYIPHHGLHKLRKRKFCEWCLTVLQHSRERQ